MSGDAKGTTALRRLDGWEERLQAAIDAARARPFAWGRHDCLIFAADVVAALTGTDLAAPHRGRYRTAIGAARLLDRLGHDGLAAAVSAHLPGVPLLLARRGDVVLVATAAGPALGICLGRGVACAAPDGLSVVPLAGARRAWRVG